MEKTHKKDQPDSASLASFECEELMQIAQVHLYCLLQDRSHHVLATGKLRLLSLPVEGPEGQQDTLTFIDVDGSHFPLVHDIPCLRMAPHVFVFPSQYENNYIVFEFPDDIPQVYVDIFERKIVGICNVKRSYAAQLEAPASTPTVSVSTETHKEPGADSATQTTTTTINIPVTTVVTTEPPKPSYQSTGKKVYTPSTSAPSSPAVAKPTNALRVIPKQEDQIIVTDSTETIMISSFIPSEVHDDKGQELVAAPPAAPMVVKSYGMASKIDSGSAYVSDQIRSGGEALGRKLYESGHFLIDNQWITANEKPLWIPTPVSAGFHYGSKVTPACVSVSGKVISGLTYMAANIGWAVGSGVQKVIPGSGGGRFGGAIAVGKSAVGAVGDIFDALEDAGDSFLQATKGTTSMVVDHKYGPDAAMLMENTIQIGGDAIKTAANVRKLYPTSVVLRMAKTSAVETAKTAATKRDFEFTPNPALMELEASPVVPRLETVEKPLLEAPKKQ